VVAARRAELPPAPAQGAALSVAQRDAAKQAPRSDAVPAAERGRRPEVLLHGSAAPDVRPQAALRHALAARHAGSVAAVRPG